MFLTLTGAVSDSLCALATACNDLWRTTASPSLWPSKSHTSTFTRESTLESHPKMYFPVPPYQSAPDRMVLICVSQLGYSATKQISLLLHPPPSASQWFQGHRTLAPPSSRTFPFTLPVVSVQDATAPWTWNVPTSPLSLHSHPFLPLAAVSLFSVS